MNTTVDTLKALIARLEALHVQIRNTSAGYFHGGDTFEWRLHEARAEGVEAALRIADTALAQAREASDG